MRIVWSPQARDNLREIYLYIAEDNPYAARSVQERIKERVVALQDNPAIGRPGRVPGTRELIVSGTPYLIPYRIRDSRLEILRVYHSARR
jgi:addiction module RelE/StbE family toxin